MPLVTLPDSDEPIEVESSAIQYGEDEGPDGFVTTAHLSNEVQRRVTAAKKNARKSLQDDDDFFTELAQSRGYEFREDGRLKGSTRDDADREERWKKQHLAPVHTQLTQAQETIESLRQTQRENEILLFADGVKPTLRDAFLREASSKLSLDEETGQWALKDGDSFRYTSEGSLAGAKELIEDMKQSQPDWFISSKMRGSGYQGNDGDASGRTYTQHEVDRIASDPESWATHRDDIMKALDEGRVRG